MSATDDTVAAMRSRERSDWSMRLSMSATRPAAVAEIAEVYERTGGSMDLTATALGVSRRTMYRWRDGYTSTSGAAVSGVSELATAIDKADRRMGRSRRG